MTDREFLPGMLVSLSSKLDKVLDKISEIEKATARLEEWRYHRDKDKDVADVEIKALKRRVAILESWKWMIVGGSSVVSTITIIVWKLFLG